MPGAGHIVHMPAHIYIRVGRYNGTIESNIHAAHADEAYIAGEKPSGIYIVGLRQNGTTSVSALVTVANHGMNKLVPRLTVNFAAQR